MNLKYFFELTEARKQATGSHLALGSKNLKIPPPPPPPHTHTIHFESKVANLLMIRRRGHGFECIKKHFQNADMLKFVCKTNQEIAKIRATRAGKRTRQRVSEPGHLETGRSRHFGPAPT